MAAAAAACVCSCSKQEDSSRCPSGGQARLTISVPRAETKADLDAEKAVNNLQVYVFNEAGTQLEAYASANASSVEISVTLGNKKIAALVNHDPVQDATNVTVLQNKVSDLSENAVDSFVMYGETAVPVTADDNVTVNVARLVSRVVINKITNAISVEQYRTENIVLKAVYLINAAGKTNFKSAYAPAAGEYYNCLENEGDVPTLLMSSYGDAAVANGASNSSVKRLYCCPNPVTEDSSADTWSPRLTRLVVETEIAGNTWYYPITLDGPVLANTSYEIPELRITRLGSTDPDTPLEIGSATFTVEVTPWTVTTVDTVVI